MSLLPKSIHRCRRYPTKFNSGRDIPFVVDFYLTLVVDVSFVVPHEVPKEVLATPQIMETQTKPIDFLVRNGLQEHTRRGEKLDR